MSVFSSTNVSVGMLGLVLYEAAFTSFRLPGIVGAIILVAATVVQFASLRFPRFVKLQLALTFWALLSAFASPYSATSLEKWLDFAKVAVAVTCVVSTVRTRSHLACLSWFLVLFFLAFPVRGSLFNYLTGNTTFGRVSWNFVYANPNDLATYSLLIFAVAVGLLAMPLPRVQKAIPIVAVAILPFVILLTQSRAATLGLLVTCGLIFFSLRKNPKPLIGAAIVAVGVVAFAPSSVWTRVAGLRAIAAGDVAAADPEGSAKQRFEIFRVATSVAQRYPIAGVGIGAYSLEHGRAATEFGFSALASGNRDTHNTYLRLAAEVGIVGLVLYLALLGAVALPLFARATESGYRFTESWAMFSGVCGFVVASAFGSYPWDLLLYFFLGIAFVTADVSRRVSGSAAANSLVRPRPQQFRTAMAHTRPS